MAVWGKSDTKSALATLSSIALLASALVVSAPAQAATLACSTGVSALDTKDGTQTSAGSSGNPYLISSAADLIWLSINQNNSLLASYFEQTAHIDLGGCAFTPIGIGDDRGFSTQFAGSYDGAGHSISGLHINDSSTPEFGADEPFGLRSSAVGLFGRTTTATIQRLALVGVDIQSTENSVGALVGVTDDGPLTIDQVFVSGSVTGNSRVAGLVARVAPTAYITNTLVRADVSGGSEVGGVLGRLESFGHLNQVVFNGTVSGSGAVPLIFQDNRSDKIANGVYWDADRTGIASATGIGESKTSAELRVEATYSGFDFGPTSPVWKISMTQNDGFATLDFQNANSYLPTISSITPSELQNTAGGNVTISGFDLNNLVSVTADGVSLAIVSGSATEVVATVPSGDVGSIEIALTTDRGTSTRAAALSLLGVPLTSTRGQDFWLTFDRNSIRDTAEQLIYVSSEVDTTATVTWPDLTTDTVSLSAGVTATISATAKLTDGSNKLMNTVYEGIANHAIRVSSPSDVSVYTLNFVRNSTDAVVVLPTSALGTEYIAMSSAVSSGLQSDSTPHGPRMSIIASEPGTTILTITPSVDLRKVIGGAGVHPAGVPYHISLEHGQVYTVVPDNKNGDLSGSTVTSDKVIAMFTATYMNSHPLGLAGAADYIYEAMTPTKAWGQSFIAVSAPNNFSSRRDVYRITAAENNTLVNIGGSQVTLARGQIHEFALPGFSTAVISSDKPIYVLHFVSGGTFQAPVGPTTSGDPSMVKVVPTTQFLNSYVVTTPAVNFRANFALITVKKSEKDLITRGGFAIGAENFADVAGTDYAVARLPISIGTHYFRAPSGFGLVLAGMDDADSYAYPGGFGVVDLGLYPGGVPEVSALQPPTAPFSVGNNLVAGTPTICSTLTVQEGGWTDGGSAVTSTTYQWLRNGVPIGAATSASLDVSSFDPGDLVAFEIRKTNSVGTTSATSKPIQLQHPGLISLNSTAGAFSPPVSTCETNYSVSTNQPWISVTVGLIDDSASLTIAGVSALSGYASNPIDLTPGPNTIPIVVNTNGVAVNYSLSVTYVEGPGIEILAPPSIGDNTATLNAQVFGRGNQPTAVEFEIVAAGVGVALSSADFSAATTISASVASPNLADQLVSASATGLTQGQRYFVRAKVSAAGFADVFSRAFEFTTRAAPAAVTSAATSSAIGSNFTSVTLSGTINPNGSATNGFMSWSLEPDMSNAVETQVLFARTGLSNVGMSQLFSGIPRGATIYYQARATNEFGTNFGSIRQLVMRSSASFSTPVATEISADSAVIEVAINPHNATTDIACLRRVPGQPEANRPGCSQALIPNVIAGNEFKLSRATLTGLLPNTTYSVQSYARNYPIGNSLSISYSGWVTFTTLPAATPTLTVTVEGPAAVGAGELIFLTYRFSEPATSFDKTKVLLSGASTGWTPQQVVEVTPQLYTLEIRPDSRVVAGTTLTVSSADPPALGPGNASFPQIADFSVDVVNSAPAISYTDSPLALNQFTTMVAANPTNTGGTASTWSVSPALPSGLSLSGSGKISGTPQIAQAAASYTITASNSIGSSSTTVSIEVTASALQPPDFSLATTNFSFERGAIITPIAPSTSGGTPDIWSISPGLPAGLSLEAGTGEITGTPTAFSAARTYQLTAANSAGSKSSPIVISVFELAPSYSASAGLTQVTQFQAITQITAVQAGGAANSFFLSGSTLPTGLAFDSATGVISGTPAGARVATNGSVLNFTVTASNSAGAATYTFQIQVMAALPDFTYPVRTANVGSSLASTSPTLSATSGAVTTYSISPALPAGLTISSSSGAISGTPTELLPQSDFTVTATNGAGSSTATFTLTVNNVTPNFTFSPTAVNANELQLMSPRTPTISAGREITWTISPTLPAGLQLNSATGTISGTPAVGTKMASTTFVLTATNSAGVRNQNITITITDNPVLTFTVPNSNLNLTEDTTQVNLLPTVTFGTPNSWTISPPLPAGLQLNSATGEITGTPSRGSRLPASGFLLSATDGVSNFDIQIDIEITPRPITFSYPSQTLVVAETVAMSGLLPSATDALPLSFSVAPSLPAGLTLDTTTGLISGTPDPGTEAAAAIFTITGVDGSLTHIFNLEIEVTSAPPPQSNSNNVGPGYIGPLVDRFSSTTVQAGQRVTAFGRNLATVSRAFVGGVEVGLMRVSSGELVLVLPGHVPAGVQSLVLESSFGRLTIQDAFTIRIGTASSSSPRFFTKAQLGPVSGFDSLPSVFEVKIYARDIVGAGKVQFLVNGREVAWVRAANSSETKLNVAAAGTPDGMVRSISVASLTRGRNVLEVYLNGERVARRIFTAR
jgi:hypothetical protein